MSVCAEGASGRFGHDMAQLALDRAMRWSAYAVSRASRNSMRSRRDGRPEVIGAARRGAAKSAPCWR
jgi:hypothetical protein